MTDDDEAERTDCEDWTPPQCEHLYEDSRKGDENDRCTRPADYIIRPKNMRTMAHFGRGLMCDNHAHKCVENAKGSRHWEVETAIDGPSDLQKVDLDKNHPSQRGPFIGDV